MDADRSLIQGANLQETLRRMESWQAESVYTDQRRFRRFPARGLAQLLPGSPLDHAPAVSVHIRDISRSGLGVLSAQAVNLGRAWQVQICDERVILASLPGYCRHCREVSEGVYLLGIEFAIEAGVLQAVGVSAADLARGESDSDFSPDSPPGGDEFVDPASIAA